MYWIHLGCHKLTVYGTHLSPRWGFADRRRLILLYPANAKGMQYYIKVYSYGIGVLPI